MSDNENLSDALHPSESNSFANDASDSKIDNESISNEPQSKRRKSTSLGRYEGKNKTKRTTTTSKVELPLASNAQSRVTVKPKKSFIKASSVLNSNKSAFKTTRATKSSSAKSSQKVPAKSKRTPKSTDDSSAVIKQLRTDLKNAKKETKQEMRL